MQLIYGIHPVANAIKSGRAIKIILADTAKKSPPKSVSWQAINNAKLPVEYWPREKFAAKFPGASHQSCAAECSKLVLHTTDYLADAFGKGIVSQQASKPKRQPLYLALDGVTDPQNLGACIRSAVAFSSNGLIFPGANSAAVTAVCAKASTGMIEWLPLIKVANLSRSLQQLQQRGFWLVSASGKDIGNDGGGKTRTKPSAIESIDCKRPLVLLMGSEGQGIGRLLLEQSDYICRINLDARVDSLNISSACAVMLHHIRYQQSR